MAGPTTASGDVKIYQEQVVGAFVETLQQNVDAFNEKTNGAIRMTTGRKKGQYQYESFFDEVSSIARRDPSLESDSGATTTKLTMDEFIGVKLHRINGPYEWNVSAAWLAGFDPVRFSQAVGEQTAVAVPTEQLNNALAALEAKLDSVAGLEHDATDGTLAITDLNSGLSKMGDQAGRVVLWVMHSKVWHDLINSQLTSTATVYGSDPFGNTIYNGNAATLQRRVLVTDSPSLISLADQSTGEPTYSTLGLVSGAATLEMTELPFTVLEGPKTKSQNLYMVLQSEYGYTLSLKGCAYNTSTGANPTDANVATAGSWVTKMASTKLLPGVIIKSD